MHNDGCTLARAGRGERSCYWGGEGGEVEPQEEEGGEGGEGDAADEGGVGGGKYDWHACVEVHWVARD